MYVFKLILKLLFYNCATNSHFNGLEASGFDSARNLARFRNNIFDSIFVFLSIKRGNGCVAWIDFFFFFLSVFLLIFLSFFFKALTDFDFLLYLSPSIFSPRQTFPTNLFPSLAGNAFLISFSFYFTIILPVAALIIMLINLFYSLTTLVNQWSKKTNRLIFFDI